MKTTHSEFTNKRVLVTGGCGFIGSHLVDSLLSLGALITVLDIQPPLKQRKDVTYLNKDILESDLFGGDNSFTYVFHLAARCDLNGKTLADYRVNYDGTKNLLQQLNPKTIKKFVFYSTQLTVGLFNETRFIEPSEPYKTRTDYGRSKIEGEKIVNKLSQKFGIPSVIIRPTSVFGPRGKEPYRDFFLSIKQGKYMHVGKADNLISMCYVKNLVSLTLLTAVCVHSTGQVFYGTDFHPYTMRQFAEAAGDYFNKQIRTVPSSILWIAAYLLSVPKAVGISVPLYPFRLRNIQCNYCYDIQNAVKIGYDPVFDLKTSMKETLDWYTKYDRDFQ